MPKGIKILIQPKVLKKVTKLVEQGYGRQIIQRELGLGKAEVQRYITAVRLNQPKIASVNLSRNRELHLPDPRTKDRVDPGHTAKTRLGEVTRLMELGLGELAIGEELGISRGSAGYWIGRCREQAAREKNRLDFTRLKLDAGADVYDLAKELQVTPATALRLKKQANLQFCTVDEWMKANASFGIKVSDLGQKFELKGKGSTARAVAILKENFKDCFIAQTFLPDGDVFLLPVKDTATRETWMGALPQARQFDYTVNDDENYMLVNFNREVGQEVTIMNITDIHVGSKAFRSEMLKETIEHIKDDPTLFAVIGGDLIEAITKACVADPQEQYEGLNSQVTEAVQLFLPIAHKIIAMEWGNHCGGRTEKSAQLDLARTMAQMLRIPYFRSRVTIDLHLQGMVRRISLAHKYGQALRMPQIITKVSQINQELMDPVHCWFSGHTHESFIVPRELTKIIPGKGFEQIRYYIANGGSFVKWSGTYAEHNSYGRAPQDIVYFSFNTSGDYHCGQIPMNSA